MKKRRLERTLRIIGGNWRSRKVSFPDREGIRPTPDRVRETLFNWLQPYIADCRCLELYAGSGILSMEALSRAARHVTLVERDRETFDALVANLTTLANSPARYSCYNCAVQDFLATPSNNGPYDIVFVDAPFQSNDLPGVLDRLTQAGMLATDDALIYLETPVPVLTDQLPVGLQIHRQGRAGLVHFCLLRLNR
jgi:16S rRNA (guanine966-N2)-methyltransferase